MKKELITKLKKGTIKETICKAICSGKKTDTVLKVVAQKHPLSKAGVQHIRLYARELLSAGDIDEKTKAKHDSDKPRGRPNQPKVKTPTQNKMDKLRSEKKPMKAKAEAKPDKRKERRAARKAKASA